MRGWNDFKKAKEESEKSSLFIRLKDGESIEGVFRGEPYFFYQKFKDPIEYEKWAEGRSFKFKINFITRDNGTPTAKIFQGGATLRDMLIDAADEYSLDTVFKIKRTGSGKDDTRYSILFKASLTPEQIKTIGEVKLNELERGKTSGYEDEPPPSDDDIPFG